MTAFHRTVQDDRADSLSLAALLEDRLGEQLEVREVGDALEGVSLRGYIGELVFLVDICDVGE
jgi:hypothetical protein